MTTTAQHFDGGTEVFIPLSSGDQLLLTAGGLFTDDDASGTLHGQLLLDGVAVDGSTINPSSVGETHTMDFTYAYSTTTEGIAHFEISSPSDTVEDTVFDYLVVSNSSSPMDLYFGFIIFFLITFFFVWLFRTKRSTKQSL